MADLAFVLLTLAMFFGLALLLRALNTKAAK
jgi:hypothetical protein